MTDTEAIESGKASGDVRLTEKEIQTCAAMLRSLKTKPKTSELNMEMFMELSGYKSAGSARNAFNAVMKKLEASLASGEDGTTSEAKQTPMKAGRKKTAANSKVRNNDEEDYTMVPTTPGGNADDIDPETPGTSASPTKRGAGKASGESPTKKPRKVQQPEYDSDGNVIPKRRGREPKLDENGERVNKPRTPKKSKGKAESEAAVEDEVEATASDDDMDELGMDNNEF